MRDTAHKLAARTQVFLAMRTQADRAGVLSSGSCRLQEKYYKEKKQYGTQGTDFKP